MINAAGRKRVVITNVLPAAEGGRFPAKAIAGKPVLVSANIFTDGHDEVAAAILIKAKAEKQWQSLDLQPQGNDLWSVDYIPEQQGTYQFQVMGWVDHFATWQKGLLKKHNAGQDIAVELQIGAQMAEEAAGRATGKAKTALQEWAKTILSAPDANEAVTMAGDAENASRICRHRDKNLNTTYPITFELTVDRERARYSTWYEVFPRSAGNEDKKHGSFKDVKNLLPRISNMGFDVLYFPPIHPIGEKNRKGRNNSLVATVTDPGSPWAIGNKTGGHKAIHPQLGNLKDFKDLVSSAKKLGIEIAMDIAFQCAPDHPYVQQHPEWFKWRPDGTVQYAENPPKRYEDILPFNFETTDWEALWQELKSVLVYWIDNGISIFRIDNPHTKSFAFWEWVIKEIKEEHPQALFLAEAFTRPRIMERLAKAGFTQSYTYFTWRNSKQELEEYMNELTTTEMAYYFQPNFWPNTPDILPKELVTGGDNNHIIRLLLAATLSSSYGIYGPVYEFGLNEPMPGKEEYIDNEKYELKQWDWNKYTKTGELMTRINRIRKENIALQSTNNISFATTTNEQIICYIKASEDKSNIIIVAINLDPHNTQSANVVLPLHKAGIAANATYIVEDLLSGDEYEWQGERNYVQLNPYDLPGHIFRIKQ